MQGFFRTFEIKMLFLNKKFQHSKVSELLNEQFLKIGTFKKMKL